MPVELISPGPVTTLLANVVYALPASPCMVDAGVVLQKSVSFAGTYSNWVGSDSGVYHQGGGHCKSSTQTTVVATKVKMQKVTSASPYEAVILADKPSNYWRLNDAGNPIVDIVGGLNGTGVGGVGTGQPGALSNDFAASFNGISAKIVTSQPITLKVPYSAEIWFKTSLTGETPLVGTIDGSGYNGLGIAMSGGLNAYYYLTYDDNTFAFATHTHGFNIPPNTWHHFVSVFLNNTTILPYINGVAGLPLQLPKSLKGSITNIFCIPEQGVIYGTWYAGLMDEVAIYPYALSAAQVAKHFQARK